MTKKNWRARTKNELIIEVWEYLDCDSVGAVELEEIQIVIGERFGRGAVESPAAIARAVADEGAVLRHPEVLECDTRWREERVSRVIKPEDLDFTTLFSASGSIRKLEAARSQLMEDNDLAGLELLRNQAIEQRRDVLIVGRSKLPEESERSAAREIALWLGVWLEQPELFEDWFSLRTSSSDFLQKFEFPPLN